MASGTIKRGVLGTRGGDRLGYIFLLIPGSEKKSLGWRKYSRREESRGSEHGQSRRESDVPSRSNSPRHHPPMLLTLCSALRLPLSRVFDDVPIYSQLLAGTLYAQLPFFLSQSLSSDSFVRSSTLFFSLPARHPSNPSYFLLSSSTDIQPLYHSFFFASTVLINNVSVFPSSR